MKNLKSGLVFAALSTILLASACSREAAAAPLDVTVGYENNSVANQNFGDEDGENALRVEVGTKNKSEKLNYGLTTLMYDDSLQAYGAYVGIPLGYAGSKFTVEPRIAVEQYRKESELTGSFGVGLMYEIVPTINVTGRYMYTQSLEDSSDFDLDGESYMVGLTKSF